MPRLSMIERDALPADQRRFHDAVRAIRRRPISGPFIVTMNSSPDLATRFAHLGHYFHARGQADESIVPIRVRTFISLVGSRALDAPYEWGGWLNWALEAGVRQDTVDAVREGTKPANLSPEEALADAFCREMVAGDHRVSDATFGAALDHFGVQELVELAMTLAYFAMIALPLNAFEIEMSAAQKAQRKPFTPLPLGGPWTPADGAPRPLPPLSRSPAAHARVPLLASHDHVAPAHQHFLDRIVRTRGWISPVFQVLLHTPDVAERVASVGEFFLYETIVPPAAKALAWLITARELDCAYTWAAGTGAAREAGLSGRVMDALEHGRPPAGLTGEQQALADFCHQLLRGNHHVTDAVYDAAVRRFGLPATIQIATGVGYVAMMSLVANTFEVAPMADDTRPAL